MAPFDYLSAIACIICAVFSTMGSLLIMGTILRAKSLRRNQRNIILLGILLSDLVMGTFALPFHAEVFLTRGAWGHGCTLEIMVVEYISAAFPFLTLWGMVVLHINHIVYQARSVKPETSALNAFVLSSVPWLFMTLIVIPIASDVTPLPAVPGCPYMYDARLLMLQTTISCFLPSSVLLITTLIIILTRNIPKRNEQPDRAALLFEESDSSKNDSITPLVLSALVSQALLVPAHVIFTLPSDEVLFTFDNRYLFFLVHFVTWCLPGVFPFLWLTDADVRREMKSRLLCGRRRLIDYNTFSETNDNDEVELG